MMDDMECEQLGDLGAKNVKSQDSTQNKSLELLQVLRNLVARAEYKAVKSKAAQFNETYSKLTQE